MTIAIIDTETTGLNPMDARLVAIGLNILHDDGVVEKVLITNDDEKQILEDFWGWIKFYNITKLVGFNLDFDWQFLKLRSLYHRLKIRHFKKYDGRVDLRLILNSNKYQKGTKLTDYCRFFGLDIEDDDFKGDAVPTLWKKYVEDGDREALEEIAKHLDKDIDRTLELYKILVECGLIEG